MSYSGEAAEQIVRMSLNGVEVAAKISGKAAERLAALLYAVLKDQKKTKGKIRLTNMLKSGKQLNVFAVKDTDLERFARSAKKYGVLYCMLKDRKAGDGLTDIMVRADDASKVNRIFERFNLATIDMASVKAEISRDKDKGMNTDGPQPARGPHLNEEEYVRDFMERVVPDEKSEMKKNGGSPENPQRARKTESTRSGRSSRDSKRTQTSDEERAAGRRPSVRKEMNELKNESRRTDENAPKQKTKSRNVQQHKAPKKKKRTGKGRF